MNFQTLRPICFRLSMMAITCAFLTQAATAQRASLNQPLDVVQTTGGVVSSASAPASLIGRDILNQGGNAVDSAVATAFALAVTWPEAGNIGGGGFMMIAPTNGDVVCIDYREKAPAICNTMTFIQQTNRHDSKMVGVPGTVRGLALAHAKFGKLPWDDLVRPSADLARNGFVVDQVLAGSLNGALRSVKDDQSGLYKELKRVYGRSDNRKWRSGDILKLPDLAATLDRIATDGPDDFYTGKTAQLLVDYMKSSGGLITSEDLRNYQAVVRVPTRTEFRGYTVFGPPPPSSGGIVISMMLQIVDELGLKSEPNQTGWTADQLHLITEAMRYSFRERAAHLGDADFVEIPDHLMTRSFAKKIAATIDTQSATDSKSIAGDIPITEGPYESPQTTHFSVVDQNGMTVSNTYTLEGGWGARVIAPGTGAVLNNEMGDFNWYPGYTNPKGRIGTLPNQIAANKRMLSSMSPTIVKQNGKTVLAVGSPGGRTIINTVFGVLLQRLAFDRSLPDAVMAGRFHHQWLPDQLTIESNMGTDGDQLKKQLESMGHTIRVSHSRQGSVHAIAIDPATGVKTGVSDWRRGGRVEVTK